MYVIRFHPNFNRFSIIDVNANIEAKSLLFLGLTEEMVCNICNLNTEFYRNMLIDNFNGILYKRKNYADIFFEKMKDCENAVEWLESLLITNKLSSSK